MAKASLPSVEELVGEHARLPAFADERNRALDKEIKEAVTRLHTLEKEVQQTTDRSRILRDHLKNVRNEYNTTQSLLNAKTRDAEGEKHRCLLAERQQGKIADEWTVWETHLREARDHAHSLQNQVLQCKEETERFRTAKNWGEEEMKQWILAQKQKEEDNLALLRYTKQDGVKIKDLNVAIEKHQREVQIKKQELETEVTETLAAQLELDKTAEDFHKLRTERQDLLRQWEEAIDVIQTRDEQLRIMGDELSTVQDHTTKKTSEVADRARFLELEQANNKEMEIRILTAERTMTHLRQELRSKQVANNEAQDQAETMKNQLARTAADLTSKRNEIASIQQQYREKTSRLEASKKKYEALQERLKRDQSMTRNLEEREKELENIRNEEETRRKALEKEMAQLKFALFKKAEELAKMHREDSSLRAELEGAQATKKNLKSKIHKLDDDTKKQQELVYSIEFKIQEMERKVARAMGERSFEETRALNAKIEELKVQAQEAKRVRCMLTEQVKKLASDRRAMTLCRSDLLNRKEALQGKISELTLECETVTRNLRKVTKQREDIMVQHDLLKLDVRRARDALHNRADEVFDLERERNDLKAQTEEREKDVEMHREILRAELRGTEEDRQKAAMKLKELQSSVSKMQRKYTTIECRLEPGDDGEPHSQVYYLIKTAQDREMLKQRGDELDDLLRLVEREVRSLKKTSEHLDGQNDALRDVLSGSDKSEVDAKQRLELDLLGAEQRLVARKKELHNCEERQKMAERSLENLKMEAKGQNGRIQELQTRKKDLDRELAEQSVKVDRAQRLVTRLVREIRKKNQGNPNEETAVEKDIRVSLCRDMVHHTLSHVRGLCHENMYFEEIFEREASRAGIPFPPRSPDRLSTRATSRTSSRASSSQVSSRATSISSSRASMSIPSALVGETACREAQRREQPKKSPTSSPHASRSPSPASTTASRSKPKSVSSRPSSRAKPDSADHDISVVGVAPGV